MNVDRQCTAKSKRNQRRCGSHAMLGAERCYHHLGKDPQAHKAAANLQRAATRVLAHRGIPVPIGDPLQELLDLAAEARSFKQALAELVGDLTTMRYSTIGGGEQLRSEVAVYERAMDRVGRLLVDIARLDIDSRVVGIQEAQALRMRRVLLLASQTIGLDVNDPAVVEAIQAAIVATAPKLPIGGA
ncbi:hypothetical protein BH10ACT8_BH10ACT8_11270 [soil metagenome]